MVKPMAQLHKKLSIVLSNYPQKPTSEILSVRLINLVIWLDCPAGTYNEESDCPACAINHYKATVGPEACTACPNNKKTDNTGSDSETDCCEWTRTKCIKQISLL